ISSPDAPSPGMPTADDQDLPAPQVQAFTVMDIAPEGFDLQLMLWGDGSGVPTSGKSLIILGLDNNHRLHIRIFDAAGNRATDTDETKLPGSQAGAIAALKLQLSVLLPPHVLTGAENARLIHEATSIVGQTPPGSGGTIVRISTNPA